MWSDEVKHGFVVAAATGQDEAAIALEMRTGALDPHPTKAPFDPTPTTLRRSRGLVILQLQDRFNRPDGRLRIRLASRRCRCT